MVSVALECERCLPVLPEGECVCIECDASVSQRGTKAWQRVSNTARSHALLTPGWEKTVPMQPTPVPFLAICFPTCITREFAIQIVSTGY